MMEIMKCVEYLLKPSDGLLSKHGTREHDSMWNNKGEREKGKVEVLIC
jgi:hypothetical protein